MLHQILYLLSTLENNVSRKRRDTSKFFFFSVPKGVLTTTDSDIKIGFDESLS